MISPFPDRTLLLASLRDYVAQLREEGLDGLPRGAVIITGGEGAAPQPPPPRPPSVASDANSAAVRSREPAPPAPATRTAAAPIIATNGADAWRTKYPGLVQTGDLAALRNFIGDCQRCKLAQMRTNLVFGVGNPHAELMFVGEGPGAEEDAQGEPFVGRAGQLLTDIIERGMGLRRAEVYICNVVKCRPPENRNPEPDEVAACEPFLFRQIELVKPKVIVGLGTHAVHALLKIKTPISKLRGNWQQVLGVRMMPTFHPAYLLRNPGDKRLVWADIQEVMKELGRPLPGRGSRA